MNNKIFKLLFVCTFFCTGIINAQTIFTYGNKPVSKAEFLSAFNKNSNIDKPTEAVYREYLDLYIKFKLKVQAAYDQKLDTLATQKNELQNFRNQIIDGYMSDESSVQLLVKEAFARSQKEINISHIYIQTNPQNYNDSVAAYAKATAAYKALQSGKNFEDVAVQYSEDPNVKKSKGKVGYITVFSLPYIFENAVYTTPVGKFTSIIRSKSGYHIFKNEGERKAIGTISVSQILLAFPPDPTPAQKEITKRKADSVYQLVTTGVPFAQAAMNNSNDNSSFQTGGLLPDFGAGKYETDFENAAFSLQKKGDICTPVESMFGYHILQLNGKNPVPETMENTNYVNGIKQKVQTDARMEVARKAMVKKMMQQTGYKKAAVNEAHLWVFADSVYHNKSIPKFSDLTTSTVIFSFKEKKLTAGDWAKYLHAVRNVNELSMGKTYQDMFQQYAENESMVYYREHLELYNPAFAKQMKEFKEGNLLFEVMQRNVWDKAAADSVGMKKYYEAHKKEYVWKPGADALVFTVLETQSPEKVKEVVQKDGITNWRNTVSNFNELVQADSGRYEYTQLPATDAATLAEGGFSKTVKNENDNNSSFVYIIKKHEEPGTRSFEDAKGFVLNDYQTLVEKQWIDQQKKKYPVKVNEPVLQSCWK